MKLDGSSVEIKVGTYPDGNNLYVGLDYYDEEMESMSFYGSITKNHPDWKLGYLEGAIDVNNMGKSILGFLIENSLAEETGRIVESGFCRYPVYKFSEGRLFELCPLKFAAYKREFMKKR